MLFVLLLLRKTIKNKWKRRERYPNRKVTLTNRYFKSLYIENDTVIRIRTIEPEEMALETRP